MCMKRSCLDSRFFCTPKFMRRHLSIQAKLTLAFIGFIACLLASTLFLARQSFVSGFEEYVTVLEQRRLSLLAERLFVLYEVDGAWPEDIEVEFFELSDMPPHDRPPPPPPHGEWSAFDERRLERPHPLSRRRRPPEGRRPPHREPHPTVLFDAHGAWLAGAPDIKWGMPGVSVSIEQGGEVVGYLHSLPSIQNGRSLEEGFADRQLKSMLGIGGVALLLAVLLSALITRRLLVPIRRLIYNISELSAGNYDIPSDEPRYDELGVLMSNVTRLSGILEQVRDTRRHMFANISHELRTPLTILTAEIEAIKDGVRKLDGRALESFDQEVARLRYLVDDLYELSVSQMGAMSYVFESNDLCDVVVVELDALGMEHLEGITLTTSLQSAPMNMDIRRMEQLVRNLLSNAIDYTDEPGRINVTLNAIAHEITLEVSDSSPSVLEEECARLFEPLYRTETSRTRSTKGAGLGLAICKNIVEAHDGTIVASLSEMGGVCITVKLPVR